MMDKNQPKPCKTCNHLQELRQRNQALEQQNSLLRYEIKELHRRYFSSRKTKLAAADEGRKSAPKKRGAKTGHPGWFREKPTQIDVIEEVKLNCCPDCGTRNLGECREIEEHIQEDIVLPRLKVTKYRRQHYWCPRCKKVVAGIGKDELPNSYLGPQAKAVAGFLKYGVKISDRDIQKIFKELCGLTLVASSIPGFNNQTRRKSLPVYTQLQQELQKAPYVHADETGCPVDGANWWDWVFATAKICFHVIRHSRGQKVVEEILGQTYAGILITDFLSAYNKINTQAKQRCLVHLLREIKRVLECYQPADFGYTYCQRLKSVIQRATQLSAQYQENKIAAGKFKQEKAFLQATLGDFQFPNPQQGLIKRIAKRLTRHKNELFTFLDYPGLPYHNNLAEQLIRPSVLLRKITFGHRSENGTRNHSVLMSILQTGKLNGKESIPLLKNILTCQNPVVDMCLGP